MLVGKACRCLVAFLGLEVVVGGVRRGYGFRLLPEAVGQNGKFCNFCSC